MQFAYWKCKMKQNLKFQLRPILINNEMHISLFIGLALSEILYIALFFIRSMRNAYNSEPTYEGAWGKEYNGGGDVWHALAGKKNAQTSSLGKHEGKRVPVRPTSRWKDDIKRSIKKHDATPWTGFIWLRLGKNDEFLCARQWTL